MINRDSPSISNGVSTGQVLNQIGQQDGNRIPFLVAERPEDTLVYIFIKVFEYSAINTNSIEWVIGFYLYIFILFSLTSSQEQNIIGRPPIVFIETIKETVRIRSKQNGKEIGYGLGSDLLFFYKFLLNVMKGNKRKNLF